MIFFFMGKDYKDYSKLGVSTKMRKRCSFTIDKCQKNTSDLRPNSAQGFGSDAEERGEVL